MSSDAIVVQGLGKMYRVYDRPQDRLKQMLWGRLGSGYGREFWALQDVSFTARKGDAIGIIGRNGCGKSTLLQMLCGTLQPTLGSVAVNGRIGALLELGSGFNPEFTGRENVHLSGAIQGMTRAQVHARLDDIIAFADIGQFIDQAVKTYSSGMFVRLAFAVVALLDPDILVVDEALAVGDMVFQAKCMRRMRELRDNGCTMLLVSHDINTIRAFSSHVLYLDHGRPVGYGNADEMTERYIADQIRLTGMFTSQEPGAPPAAPEALPARDQVDSPDEDRRHWIRNGTGEARFTAITVLDSQGRRSKSIPFGEPFTVHLVIEILRPLPSMVVAFYIKDRTQLEVLGNSTYLAERPLRDLKPGRLVVDWRMDNRLREGDYTVTAIVADSSVQTQVFFDWVDLGTTFSSSVDPRRTIWAKVALPMDVEIRQP
jgi:lipopolysaccharide transport system ATP-binding protein